MPPIGKTYPPFEYEVGREKIREYANAVGADGYAADASTAVRLAKDLIAKRRAAVPA